MFLSAAVDTKKEAAMINYADEFEKKRSPDKFSSFTRTNLQPEAHLPCTRAPLWIAAELRARINLVEQWKREEQNENCLEGSRAIRRGQLAS